MRWVLRKVDGQVIQMKKRVNQDSWQETNNELMDIFELITLIYLFIRVK